MQNRIALVSDDSDFFEYIIQKLMIRKNDEIFRYGFDSISDNRASLMMGYEKLLESVSMDRKKNVKGQIRQ